MVFRLDHLRSCLCRWCGSFVSGIIIYYGINDAVHIVDTFHAGKYLIIFVQILK